jgi:hypothetical protein
MFWCRYRTELPLLYFCGAGQTAATGLRARRKSERLENADDNILKANTTQEESSTGNRGAAMPDWIFECWVEASRAQGEAGMCIKPFVSPSGVFR